MDILFQLIERGLIPDFLVRLGIRFMRDSRLRKQRRLGVESRNAAVRDLIARLRESPIAVLPENPPEHMYEFPTTFFSQLLGKRLKFSCCNWPEGVNDVDRAEEAMLELSCRRARVRDGMEVLDLGCGAGSLSFWIADKYPDCHVLAVSNVPAQIEFIQSRCRELGLDNVEALTADINEFWTERRFDLIVSVEMFDQMRNFEALMDLISSWLKPRGKLFVQMATHREYTIPAEKTRFENWMDRHFYYGGLMFSDDMLPHFQEDLVLEDHWRMSGLHFRRTAEAWLANLDARREQILSALQLNYSRDEAALCVNRWRIMLMAVEELFGCRNGEEWIVSQYLFRTRSHQ